MPCEALALALGDISSCPLQAWGELRLNTFKIRSPAHAH